MEYDHIFIVSAPEFDLLDQSAEFRRFAAFADLAYSKKVRIYMINSAGDVLAGLVKPGEEVVFLPTLSAALSPAPATRSVSSSKVCIGVNK